MGHFPKYGSKATGGPTTTAKCDLATHSYQWSTGGVLSGMLDISYGDPYSSEEPNLAIENS